jgi:hypothetical protein
MSDDAPLNDPEYRPAYPPVDGEIPDVVARWGPRSQVRWFARFWGDIKWRSHTQQAAYYCSSVEHRGPCCISCIQDEEDGYGAVDDACCCRALDPYDWVPRPRT